MPGLIILGILLLISENSWSHCPFTSAWKEIPKWMNLLFTSHTGSWTCYKNPYRWVEWLLYKCAVTCHNLGTGTVDGTLLSGNLPKCLQSFTVPCLSSQFHQKFHFLKLLTLLPPNSQYNTVFPFWKNSKDNNKWINQRGIVTLL